MSSIGYAYALTCCLALLIAAPFQMMKFSVSRGIPSRLVSPAVVEESPSSTPSALLVYVDRHGQLFLDSKPITAPDLPGPLEADFAQRPD